MDEAFRKLLDACILARQELASEMDLAITSSNRDHEDRVDEIHAILDEAIEAARHAL